MLDFVKGTPKKKIKKNKEKEIKERKGNERQRPYRLSCASWCLRSHARLAPPAR